jgi:hypothetical protein
MNEPRKFIASYFNGRNSKIDLMKSYYFTVYCFTVYCNIIELTLDTSALREKAAEELEPISVESSDDGESSELNKIFDLDLSNYYTIESEKDGKFWLKMKLNEVNCVSKVDWYAWTGVPFLRWRCTKSGCVCSSADDPSWTDEFCPMVAVNVSTKRQSINSAASDCIMGDTIIFASGQRVSFSEISIHGE